MILLYSVVGLLVGAQAQTFSHSPVTQGRSDAWTTPVGRPPGREGTVGRESGTEALLSLLGEEEEGEEGRVRGRMLASPGPSATVPPNARTERARARVGERVGSGSDQEQKAARPRGRGRLVSSRVSGRGQAIIGISQAPMTRPVNPELTGRTAPTSQLPERGLELSKQPTRGRANGLQRCSPRVESVSARPSRRNPSGTSQSARRDHGRTPVTPRRTFTIVPRKLQVNLKSNNERKHVKKAQRKITIKKPNKEAANVPVPFLPTPPPKKRKLGKKAVATAVIQTAFIPTIPVPSSTRRHQAATANPSQIGQPTTSQTTRRNPSSSSISSRRNPIAAKPLTLNQSLQEKSTNTETGTRSNIFPRRNPISSFNPSRRKPSVSTNSSNQSFRGRTTGNRQRTVLGQSSVSSSLGNRRLPEQLQPQSQTEGEPQTTTTALNTGRSTTPADIITSTTEKLTTTRQTSTTTAQRTTTKEVYKIPAQTVITSFTRIPTTTTTAPAQQAGNNQRQTFPKFAVAVAGRQELRPSVRDDEAPSVLSPLNKVLSIVSMRQDTESDHDTVMVAAYDIGQALSHAELTWAADPFRSLPPSGQPDFSIDFSKKPLSSQRSNAPRALIVSPVEKPLHETPMGRLPVRAPFTRHLGRVETQPSASNRLRQSFAEEEARREAVSPSVPSLVPKQLNRSRGRATRLPLTKVNSVVESKDVRAQEINPLSAPRPVNNARGRTRNSPVGIPREARVEARDQQAFENSVAEISVSPKTTSLEDLTWTPALLKKDFDKEQLLNNVKPPQSSSDIFVFFRS